MPLVRSFWLSTKPKKKAWVEPIVDRAAKTVRFEVRTGDGAPSEGTKERGKTRCLVCGQSNITDAQLREQARRFGIGAQLLAVVGEGSRARVYLAPVEDQVPEVEAPETPWLEQSLPGNARWFSPPQYGLTTYRDLFTARQLVALTTFSDLVAEAREQALADAIAAGLPDDGRRLEDGGTRAPAYADALATYLAFGLSRLAPAQSASGTRRGKRLSRHSAVRPSPWLGTSRRRTLSAIRRVAGQDPSNGFPRCSCTASDGARGTWVKSMRQRL
jgi:putative DNA methylase